MLLAIVVLIPKGTSSDCRGICLLEVIWKLLERILDTHLSEIDLHDYLHGFRAKRGCGTGIMEAKLLQQLAFREQVPMFWIFWQYWRTRVWDPAHCASSNSFGTIRC